MKHLSLQWRITLLTALLIACACVCMNLLLYRTGVTGMDALNGFMMQYQPGSADPLTIEIPQEEMSSLLAHFSQEVYDAKVVFGRKGWCITVVVTIVSAAIAYFVSGRALKPLQQLAQQAQQVDQDSIATTRLDENTVQEFGQLSRSVNKMLDGLAQSFELQRQFAGNAAHELRTPLAILQTKLELFAEEHPAMDAETAGLIRSLREQLDRLTALVRTLLEMSNLQSVSRTDQIALAPLVEEILTDLTPLAQKNNISLQQDCRGHHRQRCHCLFCQRQSAETMQLRTRRRVDQDSIATTRLDENTVQEFGQLSRSGRPDALDGLAQSFELRSSLRAMPPKLRTPLAILQTKLELLQRSTRPWTPKLPG